MKKKFLESSISLITKNKFCTEEEIQIISYGLESIYLLIQFAHTNLNLLNYGNILIVGLNTTKNEVSDLIKQTLTSTILNLNLNRLIQLRLP